MRILIIHSYYLQRGGEDAVFEQETALLKEDNEVQVVAFRNKGGWRGFIQFLISVWNIFAARRIKKTIREFKPDVIHIHNWNFASGPIVIRTAKKLNIPVVVTLHNYRLICPSATLLYHGKMFMDSVNAAFPWSAIGKKVYKSSFFLTFWLSFIVWVHKKIGTWKMVKTYIVLSDSSKELFVHSSLGVSAERFVLKPNFVPAPVVNNEIKRENFYLFIGRLSEEKGINVLLESFRHSPYYLKIAGEGPFVEQVKDLCSDNTRISYLGSLSKPEVQQYMQRCSALIFPSIWHETFGLVIVEAFSVGTPVIASNIGAAQKIVMSGYNGLHFNYADALSLRSRLDEWESLSPGTKLEYTKNALATYMDQYTPSKNKALLLDIYK